MEEDEEIAEPLELPVDCWRELPLGAVVCTAKLADANQPGGLIDIIRVIASVPRSAPPPTIRLDNVGGYSRGRWLWHRNEIEWFEPPIPARGAQGFWDWEPEAGHAA